MASLYTPKRCSSGKEINSDRQRDLDEYRKRTRRIK